MFAKVISVFAKKHYISGTLGGAVIKLIRYLQVMLMMIHTKFGEEISNSLKDIANYNKIQNGGHMVPPTMANLISTDSAWPKESIDIKFKIFWQSVDELLAKIAIFRISWPVGGTVSNFGMDPQIKLPMKHTNFHFNALKFGRDTASEPILGRPH